MRRGRCRRASGRPAGVVHTIKRSSASSSEVAPLGRPRTVPRDRRGERGPITNAPWKENPTLSAAAGIGPTPQRPTSDSGCSARRRRRTEDRCPSASSPGESGERRREGARAPFPSGTRLLGVQRWHCRYRQFAGSAEAVDLRGSLSCFAPSRFLHPWSVHPRMRATRCSEATGDVAAGLRLGEGVWVATIRSARRCRNRACRRSTRRA
jgi:hypothetical protein